MLVIKCSYAEAFKVYKEPDFILMISCNLWRALSSPTEYTFSFGHLYTLLHLLIIHISSKYQIFYKNAYQSNKKAIQKFAWNFIQYARYDLPGIYCLQFTVPCFNVHFLLFLLFFVFTKSNYRKLCTSIVI